MKVRKPLYAWYSRQHSDAISKKSGEMGYALYFDAKGKAIAATHVSEEPSLPDHLKIAYEDYKLLGEVSHSVRYAATRESFKKYVKERAMLKTVGELKKIGPARRSLSQTANSKMSAQDVKDLLTEATTTPKYKH